MPVPRIAVVAVHGVADQAPNASCRQVAALLGRLEPSGAGQTSSYTPFTERQLNIPVRPLEPQVTGPVGTFFASAATGNEPLDLRFMDGQLQDYEVVGDDATYRTVRLEATRVDPSGQTADVHVYEMYWADLSRLGRGALRIFGELFQMLLHLGSLGKHTASAATGRDRSWSARVFKYSVAFASWVLAAPIALFNLYMIGAAILVLASLISGAWLKPVAILLTAGMATVAGGFLLLRARRVPWGISLAVFALIMFAATAFAAATDGLAVLRLLGTGVLLAVAGTLAYVAISYERYRPFSQRVSLPALAIVVLVGAWSLFGTGDDPALVARAGFRMAEVLFVALRVSWMAFVALLWVAMASGLLLHAERGPSDPVRRAVWTACLTLGLAAFAIIVVAVVLWSAALTAVQKQVFPVARYPTLWISRLWLGDRVDTGTFGQQLLNTSATSGFAAALVVCGAAALICGWALGPVVWAEVKPPNDNSHCEHLGHWLNGAFPMLSIAGGLVLFALAVVLPIGTAADSVVPSWWPGAADWLKARYAELGFTNAGVIATLGGAIAVPAAGIFALSGRLGMLAAGFRAPLDVLLDVDNYLREHPRGATPRARLCARYWSLLQFLRVDRPPYDALIIVAHSQGTVLTADLLRYLQYHGRGRLPPTFLLTMGSPLRQLYGECFPHLYGWAHHQSDASGASATIPDAQCPLPSELGIRRWVNAYRSGDYVGRWLWRSDRADDQFKVAQVAPAAWHPDAPFEDGVAASDQAGTRREFCVGAGAHTHYWDESAPEIAIELDALISAASPEQPSIKGETP